MLKKIFITFLASFTIVFSTVGSYANATTGNPAMDTLMRINKALFATVATGIAGSATLGLKAKEIYDENKDKIYDNALKAYDAMSESAKQSWAAAVARGRTGADMASDVWDSLSSSFVDLFKSKANEDKNFGSNLYKVNYYQSKWMVEMSINDMSKYAFHIQLYKDGNMYFETTTNALQIESYVKSGSFVNYYIPLLYINGYQKIDTDQEETFDAYVNMRDDIMNNVNSVSTLISAFNKYATNNYSISVSMINKVTNETMNKFVSDSIYDQALKRALETDIPRAKDAGLVIPQTEIKTPAGTRINLDANTGTLTLPDGTIWTGNADDLKIGVPDAIINHGDLVWSDGKTDQNVWTGEKTKTATGEGINTTGDTILDRLLEGIGEIPTAFIKVLTGLFIPTQLASAWADLTNTLKSRLLLPDFGWLVNTGIMCTEDGKDIKMEFNGKTTTFVDMSWLYSVRSFYMPIMRGFLWYLFGWYVYRKAIAITNKVDGIEK